jgi:hypothetical protein
MLFFAYNRIIDITAILLANFEFMSSKMDQVFEQCSQKIALISQYQAHAKWWSDTISTYADNAEAAMKVKDVKMCKSWLYDILLGADRFYEAVSFMINYGNEIERSLQAIIGVKNMVKPDRVKEAWIAAKKAGEAYSKTCEADDTSAVISPKHFHVVHVSAVTALAEEMIQVSRAIDAESDFYRTMPKLATYQQVEAWVRLSEAKQVVTTAMLNSTAWDMRRAVSTLERVIANAHRK